MVNNILIGASLLIGLLVIVVLYQRAKLRTAEVLEEDFSSIERVVEAVKMEMVEIVKEDALMSGTDAEFNALYKRKARIKDALRNCVYGIDSAKVIVIELIRGFIAQTVPISRVSELIGASDGMQPSDHVMFEILMYRYKKQYGKKALGEMIRKYELSRDRPSIEDKTGRDTSYFITVSDLHDIYEQENIYLTDDERIDILSILVYQQYKGFGILDTLREMDINGFNCGTSGNIISNVNSHNDGTLKATNSVWLYFEGKYIHLRFMNFGSEDELRRIVQLLVRYNNPGPLTAKRGYLVNTMYDKSRVLALRPPASEYWAIFVRKFTLSDVSPEALIVKKNTQRGDLPIRLIEFLLRGMMTCAVTGRQGSGKTTLMTSVVRYIDPRFTLRILEMAPELYLRELYPSRNILSLQETETVSATELQDALKKSDAAVSIVGEVATDAIAARMIQMGMTASLFTIFSHHANTAKDLVLTLRNSLVNAGGFNNMDTAERQVTQVVKFDIHLDYTPEGDRYVERISEIVQLGENIPYPTYNPNDAVNSMNLITKEYYERMTDRISFFTQDILGYNVKEKRYYAMKRPSIEMERKLRGNLGERRLEFDKFIIANWGKRNDLAEGEVDEVAQSLLWHYEAQEKAELTEEDVTVLLAEDEVPVVYEVSKEEIKVAEEKVVDDNDSIMTFDFFDSGVKV